VNRRNELLVNNYRLYSENLSKPLTIHLTDTLTYKFNSFIEINKKVVHYDIEYIKFILDKHFEIEIDSNYNANYICLDVWNVSNLQGNFYRGNSKKKIGQAAFTEIANLLEYINVKELSNNYILDGYDFDTVFIEIKFKNGDIKKITDYGYQGTYGLQAVYNKMKKLAQETEWN